MPPTVNLREITLDIVPPYPEVMATNMMSREVSPITTALTINSARLQQKLTELAKVGRLADGGVSRLAFSNDDRQARKLVSAWMTEAGMSVRVDTAGNIIGRYAGHNDQAPVLATGSHIDTVSVAGRYDGSLGVIAGIEVVQTLYEHKVRLQHPVEVIVFTDEELSMLGCKAIAGTLKPDPNVYQRQNGMPIQAALQSIGGNWHTINLARRTDAAIAAFIELHVEQGGVLEQAQAEIGVVQGVVGQHRFSVEILGRPNHAGTTPMNFRQDALVAAAQVILTVNQLAVNTPGEQVATVGYLDVLPNSVNTVPSKVELKIDIRDLSQAHLNMLIQFLEEALDDIADTTRTQIKMSEILHISPTPATPMIMDVIETVCQDLGYTNHRLPSRAGHDAQEIGRFTHMGMIFVPSRHGVSHSAKEYTSPEQCAQGTNVLLRTLVHLDYVERV